MTKDWHQAKSLEAQFAAYSRYVSEMETEYESLKEWNQSILRFFEIQKAPHIISIEATFRRMKSGEEATKQTLNVLNRIRDAYHSLYKSSEDTTLFDEKLKKRRDHTVVVPHEAEHDRSIMSLATLTTFWYDQSAEYHQLVGLLDIAIADCKSLMQLYGRSGGYHKIKFVEGLERRSETITKHASENLREYSKVISYYAKYRNSFDNFASKQSHTKRRDVWKQRSRYLMNMYQLWCIHKEYCTKSLRYSQELMAAEDKRVDQLSATILSLSKQLHGQFKALTINLHSCITELSSINNEPAPPALGKTASSVKANRSSYTTSPTQPAPATIVTTIPKTEKAPSPSPSPSPAGNPPPPRPLMDKHDQAAAMPSPRSDTTSAGAQSSPSAKATASEGGSAPLSLMDAISKKAQAMNSQAPHTNPYDSTPHQGSSPTSAGAAPMPGKPTGSAAALMAAGKVKPKSDDAEPIPSIYPTPPSASPAPTPAPAPAAVVSAPAKNNLDDVPREDDMVVVAYPTTRRNTTPHSSMSDIDWDEEIGSRPDQQKITIIPKPETVNKKIEFQTQLQKDVTSKDLALLERLPAFPIEQSSHIVSLGIEKHMFSSRHIWLVYTKSFHIYCVSLYDGSFKKDLPIDPQDHTEVVSSLFLTPQPQLEQHSSAIDIRQNGCMNAIVDGVHRQWKLNALNTIATAHGAILTLTEYNEGFFSRNKEHVITLSNASIAQEWVTVVNFHNKFPGNGSVPPLTRSQKKKIAKQAEEEHAREKKKEEAAKATAA